MAFVRIASREDRDATYRLMVNHCIDVNDWLTEIGLPISLPKFHDLVTDGCERTSGIIGLIDGEGGPIASIGLFPVQPWWSEAWCLSQHWLYVHPSMRGKGLENDLFEFAQTKKRLIEENSGERLPLDISVLSRDRLMAKLRMWKKHATMIGGIFMVK